MISSIILSSLLLATAQASWLRPRQTNSSCPAVHIIVARASGEEAGEGIIGAVATQVMNANNGTTVEAINYPATLQNYFSSSSQGTAAMVKSLQNIVNQCSSTKVVLMGYSQGAQVVGDAICGGGGIGPGSTVNQAIDSKFSDKVVAMIMMGDPRHVPSTQYDVGTSTQNGLFPRNGTCDKYASKMQSYCDTGDPFCSGGKNLSVHTGYVKEYGSAAMNFTDMKLKASSSGSISGATDVSVKTVALIVPLALMFAAL